MISKLLRIRLLVFVLISLFTLRLSAADIAAGKTLFANNCGSCHNKNMKDKMTGPPLGKAVENWGGDMGRLYSWVRNSQAMVSSGDPRAVAIFKEYNRTAMSAFPTLKDADIDNIFA